MKIVEHYNREYLYDAQKNETGLIFTTDHADGFMISAVDRIDEDLFDKKVRFIIENIIVQSQELSDETTKYLRDALQDLLEGRPCAWKITTVEPRPNYIRFRFTLKDERQEWLSKIISEDAMNELERQDFTIALELRDRCNDTEHLATLYLWCLDGRIICDDIYYLQVQVSHKKTKQWSWQNESAYVKVSHLKNSRQKVWHMLWKDASKTTIIANIESIHSLR